MNIYRNYFKYRIINLIGAFCLIGVAGILISIQSYVFLGIMVLSILSLIAANARIEILLIYLLIISIPFFKFELFPLKIIVGNVGDVSIHLSHILAIILIFTIAIRMIPKIGRIRIDRIGKALLLVLVIYFTSIVGVYNTYQNYIEYFKSLTNIFLFAFLYFAFSNSIKHHDTVKRIIKIWISVSIFVGVYGLYQLSSFFITSLPLIPGTEIVEYGGIPRVSSILKEPVPFILYLIYPIIFLSVMVIEKQNFPFKKAKANSFALVILLMAFILSFSLTGLFQILTLATILSFSQVNSGSRGLKKLWLPLAIVCVFITVAFATDFGRVFLGRLEYVQTFTDPSTIARIQSVSIALEEFLRHPMFGIGAGNFASYTAAGLFPGRVQYEIYYSDTLVTHILAELGILGTIAIGLFFGTMLSGLRKVIEINKMKGLNFHISRGLFFMILTYVISIFYASGWLEFWAWVNFSVAGSWVLLESRRLKNN